jgi:DNA-binding transcriptional regulator YbjK
VIGGTTKGRVRHEAIVEAAAAILLDHGLDAVTHRAVAERAGVPLASTTYYFASHDDLVLAAIERAAVAERVRADVDATAPLRRRGTSGLAERLVAVVIGRERVAESAAVGALYARFIEAARRPLLRPAVARWQAGIEDVVSAVLRDHGRVGLTVGPVLALVDGAAVSWLAGGTGDPDVLVRAIADGLRHLSAPANPSS